MVGDRWNEGTGQVVRARFGGLGRVLTAAGEAPDRSRRLRRLGVDTVAAFDVVLMVLILGLGYGELSDANARLGPADDYPSATLYFLMATLTVPLLLRDRRPLLAWVLSAMSTLWTIGVARDVLDAPFVSAAIIVPLYCLYTVASRYDRRVTAAAVGITLVVGTAFIPRYNIWVAALVAVPVLIGVNVRGRRQARYELAEQEQRHQEERAVLEERQRIARELHDVVAHHMSVIAIHAEAAPYKVAEPPAELAESFADIRASALEGLTELRRILGVLRAEQAPQTAPQPGLAGLDELIASARNGGLTVETTVTGEPMLLPDGVGLSAYRILQEALSNAMKHSPGTSVHVELGYAPGTLRLHVINGPPDEAQPAPAATVSTAGTVADSGSGHGLVGMRERAAMLGGTLETGPTGDGGYRVLAVLPLDDVAQVGRRT